MTEHPIPSGWYPDPYGVQGLYRWWDGNQWTARTTANPGQRPEPAPSRPADAQLRGGEPSVYPTQAVDDESGWSGFDDVEENPAASQVDWQHGPAADWGEAPAEPRTRVAGYQQPEPPPGTYQQGWGAPGASGGRRPAQGPALGAPPGPPGPPPKKHTGLLIGCVAGGMAVVLLAVVGVVFYVLPGNDGDTSTGSSPTATKPSVQPSSTRPPSPQSTSVPPGPRVSAGGISYTALKSPWSPSQGAGITEFKDKDGQLQYTQRDAPGVDGGAWIANITVGNLSDQFNYAGPKDLPSTTAALANSVEHSYYKPWKLKRKDLGKKKISVSGKQGYQIKFHLAFQNTPKGFKAKGETVLVAVIDNSPRADGVYVSIPDNKPKLRKAFGTVFGSLRVQ